MSEPLDLHALREEIRRIIASCEDMAQRLAPRISQCLPALQPSGTNLAHYLGMRRLELRHLQSELGRHGLSSLGRCEGQVLETLRQVALRLDEALQLPLDSTAPPAAPHSIGIEDADALLRAHAQALLGEHPEGRHVLVMVTSPPAAEVTDEWATALLAAGMNCLRVNCGTGEPSEWQQIAETLKRATAATGTRCRLLFDLPGPKVRTRALQPSPEVLHIRRKKDELGRTAGPTQVKLALSGPGVLPVRAKWLKALQVGDTIHFKDTSGRRRCIQVTERTSEAVLAESEKSFYITSGTRLRWYRGHRKMGKSRCGAIEPRPFSIELAVGDVVTLCDDGAKDKSDGSDRDEPAFGLSMPGLLDAIALHDRVLFDDGGLAGVVIDKAPSRIRVQIASAKAARVRLKDKKGVSFPDSVLPLPFLTEQDRAALDAVIELADLLAFSFVRGADDVKEALALVRQRRPELGVVVKLETRQGFDHLPAILFQLMSHAPVGLMIARGDLAVECGFERLAELQEEILWLCEACHMPVIWATQVLESLAQTGIPTRAEITDAAMAMRAECVMLNRGPHIVAAVKALVDIIQKMEHHQYKKRQLYRPLHIADMED